MTTASATLQVDDLREESFFLFSGTNYVKLATQKLYDHIAAIKGKEPTHKNDENVGFSCSAWFQPTTDCNGHQGGHILAAGGGWNIPGFSIWLYNNGIRTEFAGQQHVINDVPLGNIVHKWFHVAVSVKYTDKSSSEIRVFINGVQETKYVMSQHVTKPNTVLRIGSNGGNWESENFHFKGYLAHVKMYDIALTPSQVVDELTEEITLDETYGNSSTSTANKHLLHYFPLTKTTFTSTGKGVVQDVINKKVAGELHANPSSWTTDKIPYIVKQEFKSASSIAVDIGKLYGDNSTTDLVLVLPPYQPNGSLTPLSSAESSAGTTTGSSPFEVTNGTRFEVHRIILASRSASMKSLLFNSGMRERHQREIVLTDNVSAEAFQEFIKYLYTDSASLSQQNAVDVLMLADKYQVYGLKQVAEMYVVKSVSIDNACILYDLASSLNAVILSAATRRFIKINNAAIRQWDKKNGNQFTSMIDSLKR